MTAAHYVGNHEIRVDVDDQVAPGPGQVRIAVAYTGICGTDLHIYHGDMDQRVTQPAVLGHEMSGRIAEVGPGVTEWAVGDAVTVMPLAWCGECPACLAGNQHICHRLVFIGIDSPGSMQTSWTVPTDILVRLPSDLPLEHGALVEPTAVAVHDVRRADLKTGEHVVVVGGGPVGILIATVAREAGAEVLLLELDAFRREIAEGLGLRVVDPGTEDVAALVSQWTGGAGADVTFEVSGSQPGLDTAIDILSTRGRMVLVAIHPQPRPLSLFRVFWRELTIVGARVYERADFERAVELVHAGRVPVAALISRIVGLDSAQQAFELLNSGSGVVKILVASGDAES
jgi:2-desacetyl-2-hydroxyethyl bacteriochlorophyllide A dehydrogenase